jgi:hypothetical protein
MKVQGNATFQCFWPDKAFCSVFSQIDNKKSVGGHLLREGLQH